MVVVKGKRGEGIEIGEEIEVRIVGIEGDEMKVGMKGGGEVEMEGKEV